MSAPATLSRRIHFGSTRPIRPTQYPAGAAGVSNRATSTGAGHPVDSRKEIPPVSARRKDRTIPLMWADVIGSAVNRLEKYYEHDHLRRLFGQTNTGRVIDWRRVMDSGQIVLVRLTGGNLLANDQVDLIGTLLVNEFIRAAKRPPVRTNNRDFYLIADEFQRVANRDFMELLQEARKFRLFAVLSHQDPAGLRQQDEQLYLATLTNARCKLLFGGIHTGELESLIADAFAGTIDADLVKPTSTAPTLRRSRRLASCDRTVTPTPICRPKARVTAMWTAGRRQRATCQTTARLR